MEKINDPFALEKLATNLRRWESVDDEASLAYLRTQPQKGLLGRLLSGEGVNPLNNFSTPERLRARNTARFKEFPNEVEISPEIAAFLYAIDQEHREKEKKLEATHGTDAGHYFKLAVGVPLNLALMALWPSPATLVEGGANIAGTFAGAARYEKELKKLIDERAKLVGPILGNYQLTENGTGGYVLKLQELTEGSYRVSTGRTHISLPTKEVPRAGIDPNLNPQNLPPLSKSPPGRGT